ncbi:MAG TPA: O-antigen ligase family protein [Gaiellaceae bacterium]|nr:O-antigen ligase family protein [Gaiellaceae bacterium]
MGRGLAVAAPLLLTGLALFFGGGPGDGSVFWLGAGALVAIAALLLTVGAPSGWPAILPLAALAVWCAVSISWSGLPDRSWDYANRTILYALFAALGLWAAARTRALANGLAALLGAVIVWSLLGKVLPFFYDYGGPDVTRLRGPIGLWNQLALATDFALALALALRGRAGTLLAYSALVALLLTYSRGGILTAALVCVVWFCTGDRLESAVTLIAAALPAAVVGGIGFALPGVTSDSQSLHVRWRDGLVFGALLAVGAVVALVLERLPRPRETRVLRRAAIGFGVLAVAGATVAVAVNGIGSGAVGNGGGRISSTSSNFRFTWWSQAWRGFTDHVLWGNGAGSFHLLNLLYRKTYLDYTIEPHNLPVQMLAELGLIGLALLVVACFTLLRGSMRRSGHELALALLLPAFLVHSLVDVDWDFAAVAAPAFVAAGALVGGPAVRRVRGFSLLPALGVALVVLGSLISPWLARRWATEAADAALADRNARAITLADRAHALDPFLLAPYYAKADAAATKRETFRQYVLAVQRQPKNPQPWLFAGEFALQVGCPYAAWQHLERYTELDQESNGPGGEEYNAMLDLVDNHEYTC